ncbi:protein translocase subunit SecF, partial [Alloalcanivorax marinus]|uniref:protein translocase subunit SecF n=1 Tax=Alloalcanivorax marinus TaxID=1177169 RepID=UPI0021D3AEDC
RFAPHFAWAALITLMLDVSKTLGFFVLTGVEFNLTAVAALLTLIGYSVNDKVVVFDRMRENQALEPDRPLEEIIDVSLTQTLRRTLFTSLTTFLAILPMGLAGGPAVASFALPVLFGIVVGTSSSIWIAAPMALWLARRRPAERREEEAPPADPDDEKALFARVDRL